MERERVEQEVRESCVGEEEGAGSGEIEVGFSFSPFTPQAAAVLFSVLTPSLLASL